MFKVCGVIIYISVVTPMFTLALLPICAFYVIAQRYYIKTSRELARLDSVSRSPIYALFSETLDGLNTIRAFAGTCMHVYACVYACVYIPLSFSLNLTLPPSL